MFLKIIIIKFFIIFLYGFISFYIHTPQNPTNPQNILIIFTWTKIDEIEYKITTCLKYNELSCRYDSFLLLQIYIFNGYFTKLNIKLNNKETSLFDNENYIYSLLVDELNKGFSMILSNSNLKSLKTIFKI